MITIDIPYISFYYVYMKPTYLRIGGLHRVVDTNILMPIKSGNDCFHCDDFNNMDTDNSRDTA